MRRREGLDIHEEDPRHGVDEAKAAH